MKMLILSGSRNPQGQTAQAAGAFAQGAEQAGADVETIFLPSLSIERCRQCQDDGWGMCRFGERCTIDDDWMFLMERIRQCDVLVCATPVYFNDLSESLRALLDRVRRVCIHGGKKDRIEGKRAVGICVAGGGGGGAPQCAKSIEYALSTCGFDVYDTMAVRRQNLEAKCGALREMGRSIASN